MNRRAVPQSWPRAVGLAALTLWLPAVLPFGIGPLQECSHCVQTYALFLPLVPGIVAPVLLHLEDAWFAVVGGVAVLGMLIGMTAVLRNLSWPWSAMVQTAVMLAVGVEAYLFSCLLRM